MKGTAPIIEVIELWPEEGRRVDVKSLGRTIREQRMMQGLSQDALAARAGISVKHLSVLERGLKEPRLSTFLSLASALKLTPNDLLSTFGGDYDYATSILYKVAQLPLEEQKRVLRIIEALIEEM